MFGVSPINRIPIVCLRKIALSICMVIVGWNSLSKISVNMIINWLLVHEYVRL